jgi:hypothetical protein
VIHSIAANSVALTHLQGAGEAAVSWHEDLHSHQKFKKGTL